MSLFAKEDVFEIDPNKDYSAELVGEGKPFKDLQALARSKVESNVHISRLEKETKELRDELQKRLTAEEIMTKITQAKQEIPPEGNQLPKGDTPAPSLSKEELEKIVSQKLSESEAARVAQSNFDTVISELNKAWGNDFRVKLAAKAKELGLGQDWLTQLAGDKPAAFLTLVGVNAPVQKDVSPFSVSPAGINTQGLSNSGHRGEKTAKYYAQLKITDPKRYHTKETQMEQYNQAMKLGEAYFDLS